MDALGKRLDSDLRNAPGRLGLGQTSPQLCSDSDVTRVPIVHATPVLPMPQSSSGTSSRLCW